MDIGNTLHSKVKLFAYNTCSRKKGKDFKFCKSRRKYAFFEVERVQLQSVFRGSMPLKTEAGSQGIE